MQITRGGFAIVVPKGPTTTQDPLLREVRPKLSSHRGEPGNCHVGSLGDSSATATDPEVNRHQSPAARHPPSPKTGTSNRPRGRSETAPNVDRSNGVARIVACPRDVAQPGRALRSGRRGRRFKSCHPDSKSKAARRIRFAAGCLSFPSGKKCRSGPWDKFHPISPRRAAGVVAIGRRHASAEECPGRRLPWDSRIHCPLHPVRPPPGFPSAGSSVPQIPRTWSTDRD